MSDNKKYYYMKLKEDFFNNDSIIMLESMNNGILYSNILLKLYCKSLRHEGRLSYNERIPYNSKILSQITRMNSDIIEKALKVFIDLDLIEILDNGAIYMLDIQNYIGKSSTEADRKRDYRGKIEVEKIKLLPEGQMSGHLSEECLDKNPPEIEIEIEIDKDKPLSDIPDPEPEKIELILSKELFTLMRVNNPKCKEPNFETWSNKIKSMIRLDERSIEDIRSVINWCQGDNFWKTNILSPSKLRDQFDALYIKMIQTKKPNNNNKAPQETNYEQRKYDDDFYKSLYDNV